MLESLQFGLVRQIRRVEAFESRLNTGCARHGRDERLYRIVDALAEIAARRGVSIPRSR
jgi:hypothetical protein